MNPQTNNSTQKEKETKESEIRKSQTKEPNKLEEDKNIFLEDIELAKRMRADLNLSEYMMKQAIQSVEKWVEKVENERNLKMRSDFEKEKQYKLKEQDEIKGQIEELSNDNDNEKLIQYFNERINQQQNLYEKYFQMNNEITSKIRQLKSTIPSLEEKVKAQNERLKFINKENLKLMDQITKLENEVSLNENEDAYQILGNMIQQSLEEGGDGLTPHYGVEEIIEGNQEIKNQYEQFLQLKKIYQNNKTENKHLMSSITEMNTESFSFKKIFNIGMHEIAKELLKIHEMQLDKVINTNNSSRINNSSETSNKSNSLYFEIMKGNVNGNEKKNDEELKLPIINSNIKKKYNYPLVEKETPDALIYKVIKRVVDENKSLNKVINMKKNRFSWEEFKNFSAYQIYTILNLNKDVIKKLEHYVFPVRVAVPDDMD